MAKKLSYFNINGYAESIRYMLHYCGEEFEDIRYERSEWPIESIKNSLPFGQLPLYEEGDKKLNQSLAIARYIGNKHNLVPTDPWEQAVLDATVYNIYDFVTNLKKYFTEEDPVKKEAVKKQILEETVVYFFSRFEKQLKKNNGHFGGKLTWADFIFIGIVETMNLFFGVEIEKDYPTAKELIEKIRSLPGVKEYIAKRKPYVNAV